MGLGPLGLGQRRTLTGAVDHEGETFLGVVNDGEIVYQLLLFLCERHDPTVRRGAAACKRRAASFNSGMVNPLWLWRGLKGNSVTAAALFASVLIGASIAGGFRHLLAVLGVHWLYVILIPIFFFSWLDRKEPVWFPDEAKRRLYARCLIVGSVLFALVVVWLRR